MPNIQEVKDQETQEGNDTQETELQESSALSPLRAYAAIGSMAFGSFAYGTNEFITAGFLPKIADTFSISISTAGWVTTSSFMLGAAISAPIVAITTTKIPRKYLLIGLTSNLMISAGISAWSPNFKVLIAGRVLASFSQAAYMGVASIVSASLVPKSKAGFATSMFFTGLTLSNLAGVPLDTFFGNKFHWRDAFFPVCGLAGLATIGQIIFLPKKIPYSKPDFRTQFYVFKKSGFWFAFATSAFGYCGMLASHTYFANMMTELAGYNENDIPWLTLVYGAGTVVGNILGGKAADKNLKLAVPSLLLSVTTVLGTYTFSTYYKIPAAISLFLNGLTGFSLFTPLVGYTMSKVEKEEQTLAVTGNISAFGLGIALGIYLSGLAIDLGYGYSSPNVVGALLTFFGLIAFFLGELKEKLNGSFSKELKESNRQSLLEKSTIPQSLFGKKPVDAHKANKKEFKVPSLSV